MMKRHEFTYEVSRLIVWAKESLGLDLLADWWKRDAEVQKRMYDAGLSKCDGTERKSDHQSGKAVDLYIVVDGELSWDAPLYSLLHERWEERGGKKVIPWDLGHFAG